MKKIALIIGNMIAGGIISTAGFTWPIKTELSTEKAPTTERKVLFWYDPMYPNTRFDKPKESSFMGMDLVPKYADEESSTSGVRIDPTQTRNLRVKTATVAHEPLTFAQGFPTNVSYNEYQYAIVQVHAAGFINKVYPLTMNDKVRKGALPLGLTVPDWVKAQNEYLLLRETGGIATQTEGILERLRLAGIPEADIRRSIATQKIRTRFTFEAPIDGVIATFDLRAGINITKDNVVAKIQGMDPVWATVAIPESIARLVKGTLQLTLTVPARPDKTLTVHKWTLPPGVDAVTRTLRLRLEIDNADEALKPGMNAWLQLNTASEPIPLIPSQALIGTGSGQRMITVDADGRFVPKRVVVLQTSQGVTALRPGLAESEKMISSGPFLIDSEADISGVLEQMRSESVTHAR